MSKSLAELYDELHYKSFQYSIMPLVVVWWNKLTEAKQLELHAKYRMPYLLHNDNLLTMYLNEADESESLTLYIEYE